MQIWCAACKKGGHSCVAFDLHPENVQKVVADGATGATSLEDLVKKLAKPCAVWVMVPAGKPTESNRAGLGCSYAIGRHDYRRWEQFLQRRYPARGRAEKGGELTIWTPAQAAVSGEPSAAIV